MYSGNVVAYWFCSFLLLPEHEVGSCSWRFLGPKFVILKTKSTFFFYFRPTWSLNLPFISFLRFFFHTSKFNFLEWTLLKVRKKMEVHVSAEKRNFYFISLIRILRRPPKLNNFLLRICFFHSLFLSFTFFFSIFYISLLI